VLVDEEDSFGHNGTIG